ncbi:hypothetical protein D9M68_783130 [compost metagenome]
MDVEIGVAPRFELLGSRRVTGLDYGRLVSLEHGVELFLGSLQPGQVGLGQHLLGMLALVAVDAEQLLGLEHVVGPGAAHLADEVHARHRIRQHPLGALLDGEHAQV